MYDSSSEKHIHYLLRPKSHLSPSFSNILPFLFSVTYEERAIILKEIC